MRRRKKYDPQSYYNKTITFTGKSYYYGFDTKGASDNYGNLGYGKTTQRKIIETYWDDVDWENLLDTPPANSDEVKKILDEAKEKAILSWKDLSFTVTKTDTATITVNLPAEFSDWGWGTSVTMPLYEDFNKYQADYPSSNFMSLALKEGSFGLGVKVDGDKRLTVEVDMLKTSANDGGNKNIIIDSVRFRLSSEVKNEYADYYDVVQYIDTVSMCADFKAKPVRDEFGGVSVKSVLSVNFYPEITITDAK